MSVQHEIVIRKDGSTYIRKIPARDFDSSSDFRKKNMINFAEIAVSSRGKKYEEVIEAVQDGMQPVGRKVKERIIELTPEELDAIRIRMLKEGVDRVVFPEGYSIIVKPAIPIDEIEKLITE